LSALCTPLGRVETGHIAAQRVRVVDAQDGVLGVGVCRIKLNTQPGRGHIALHLDECTGSATLRQNGVARRYQNADLENRMPVLGSVLSFGNQYVRVSQGALFGFCLACVASNVLRLLAA